MAFVDVTPFLILFFKIFRQLCFGIRRHFFFLFERVSSCALFAMHEELFVFLGKIDPIFSRRRKSLFQFVQLGSLIEKLSRE